MDSRKKLNWGRFAVNFPLASLTLSLCLFAGCSFNIVGQGATKATITPVTDQKVDELVAQLTCNNTKAYEQATDFIAMYPREVEEAVAEETITLAKLTGDQIDEESRRRLAGLIFALSLTQGEKASELQNFVFANSDHNPAATCLVVLGAGGVDSDWDASVIPICGESGRDPAMQVACSIYSSNR